MKHRSARPLLPTLALFAVGAALAACEDPMGFLGDPMLTSDEVEIATPHADRPDTPSAIDLMALEGTIGGGRFPESSLHAMHWDVTLRERDGDLMLVTPGDSLIGLDSRAGLAPAVTDRSFEEVREAPADRISRTRTLPVREDHVYIVRTRREGGCEQFSKITPVELDLADGRVVFRIVTNASCGDVRLHLDA